MLSGFRMIFFRLEHIIVHANALIFYCKSVIIVFKNVTLTKYNGTENSSALNALQKTVCPCL